MKDGGKSCWLMLQFFEILVQEKIERKASNRI
jgi:hypothetical protein